MDTIRPAGICSKFELCSDVPNLCRFCRMYIAFLSNYKGFALVRINLVWCHQICWLYISNFEIQNIGSLVIA